MTETFVLQALFLYLPYILALALAFFARSLAARRLVMIVASLMLLALTLLPILTQGCTFDNFVYRACPRIGRTLAGVLSVVEFWLVVAHFFLMPLLALLAVTLEWRARRRG